MLLSVDPVLAALWGQWQEQETLRVEARAAVLKTVFMKLEAHSWQDDLTKRPAGSQATARGLRGEAHEPSQRGVSRMRRACRGAVRTWHHFASEPRFN